MLENNIKYNIPISINTKNGNAVVISEEDYNNLMETLFIESNPKLKKEILSAKNSPDTDFVSEDEVDLDNV